MRICIAQNFHKLTIDLDKFNDESSSDALYRIIVVFFAFNDQPIVFNASIKRSVIEIVNIPYVGKSRNSMSKKDSFMRQR